MYQEGQRRGLAIAALGVALIGFFNLLNFEKSLLAILLAVLALRGATKSESAYGWSRIAIVIAVVNIILVVTLLVIFHNSLADLLRLLQTLG